jgi:hypothetical protein
MTDDQNDQSTCSIYDRMRAVLKPGGTAPVVLLHFNGPMGYTDVPHQLVTEAIDTLEQTTMLALSGVTQFNALEQIGALALLHSANLR